MGVGRPTATLKMGMFLLAITGGGGERGFAHVPIPVAENQHGLEILEALQRLLQGGVEVGAIDGVGVGGRGRQSLPPPLWPCLAGQPELGVAPGVQPLGAADDLGWSASDRASSCCRRRPSGWRSPGVTLRWRCSTYSGRSRVKTSSVTNKKRRPSSRPTARARALRRQWVQPSQPA
jgi:hypothetical protein